MSSAKSRLPLQLQRLPADHLQKVRSYVQGLLEVGLQEIADLNALDEILAANLQPQSEDTAFAVGQRVQIGGLNGAKELNGQFAQVVKFDDSAGRYIVELESDGAQKSLKGANLTAASGSKSGSSATTAASSGAAERERSKEKPKPAAPPKTGGPPKDHDWQFKIGERVRAGGLNGAKELNGQLACVFGFDRPKQRYTVEFENGQGQRQLKADNLTSMGASTGALAAKARMFAEMS
mmetsp:Transcript_103396/g.183684  ORF Transcript_103396/g.183684 Transcript_103396/m.183684 type:complete len:236 (+) Transcript_103396:54-761(+)|eukprot:CAMPEP_0197664410 /NCGR_PEP_ID=MMETSP1338-20131121/58616_1 /TAXON_ID=43686 ORGANISM="Pelagodinium beii, Strain RCC1491" /NCGR_SAMPLE_ID=MMETSP1338 /ASSEMBLY_ACC=CAM_ASM_000754 /LENGTH=235 /DNA_ID=CAMNT_0043243037 /DNA_START=55 /DNA_END=762 /DNA_ORIENTATION=+